MKESLHLVDSHAHLSLKEFEEDRSQVIQRAFKAGVLAILCPAEVTEAQNLDTALKLIEKYENIIIAAGVHPHQARLFNPECSRRIKDLARAHKIKAVGEIGLDFHYNFSEPYCQQDVFRFQLHLAQELDLPVIIHSRESSRELLACIKEEKFSKGGIIHCFTEDWYLAEKMMDLNFLISFSGIITFPKAYHLRETAKKIPLEKLLIETDSPYLVPLAYRGKLKRNEPLYVKEVANTLAAVKDLPLELITETTTRNFKSFFCLK